jgi:hypothetical protein
MTETKEDIQAQLDQLEMDWEDALQELEYSYLRLYPIGFVRRLPNMAGAYSALVFGASAGLLSTIGIYSLVFGQGRADAIMGAGVAMLGGIGSMFAWGEYQRRKAAVLLYEASLISHKEEQDGLFKKLDALD